MRDDFAALVGYGVGIACVGTPELISRTWGIELKASLGEKLFCKIEIGSQPARAAPLHDGPGGGLTLSDVLAILVHA